MLLVSFITPLSFLPQNTILINKIKEIHPYLILERIFNIYQSDKNLTHCFCWILSRTRAFYDDFPPTCSAKILLYQQVSFLDTPVHAVILIRPKGVLFLSMFYFGYTLFISAPVAIMREIRQRYFKRKSSHIDDFLESSIA